MLDFLCARWVRHLPRIALALLPVVFMLSHVSGGPGWSGIDRLDAHLQDARLRLTLPRTMDPRIVIVDIDEKSLAALGRWPWSRDRLARLVDELFDRQQVALVGFGQVFGAPGLGTESGLDLDLDPDRQFARALRQRPVVLGFHFTREPSGGQTGVLPAPVWPADRLQGRSAGLVPWSAYRANPARLAEAAPAAGFLEFLTDADGGVRSVPLLASHGGAYHEALALAMFRVMLGHPSIEPGFPEARFPARYRGLNELHLRLGPATVSIPVGDGVAARLPFRGPGGASGGSFRYVSAVDLLAGRVPAGSLQGKLVLVGATAAGLDARHVTPVGADYPAIEIHASLLSGLIDGRLPVRPDYAAGYGLLVLLGAGLLLAFALPVLSAGWATLLWAGVTAGIVGLNLWLFTATGLALPLAPALCMAAASFALSMGYAGVVMHRAHRGDLQASSRHLTVMFCDIRNFTQLAERLEPLALQALLHRVFGRLTDVIDRHGGTLDKYIGDCVMAFWGAPVAMPDHARRAVAAALALSHAVQSLNAEHRAQGLPEIEVGIGLNTGLMCVGDMGSPRRRAYTVVGDAVNLAARLERLSARYGVTVVAGEATRREADDFEWQELDKVRVKGRSHAAAVYAPRARTGALDPSATDELRTWAALLKAYRAQDVSSCEKLLSSLAGSACPQPLRALYAQRVAAMRGRPFDPAWDGATPVDVV